MGPDRDATFYEKIFLSGKRSRIKSNMPETRVEAFEQGTSDTIILPVGMNNNFGNPGD